jgi:DNA-binding transcriptional regulator YbjK
VLERRLGPSAPADSPPGGPAVSALASIERAQRRLDAILEAARGGRVFTAQELLGLQASAYRYAQTVELASKLVEHGAQSVKQTLNTQI